MDSYVWMIAVAVIVTIWFLYKKIQRNPERAAKRIAASLNIKPHLVTNMICEMSPEKGMQFVNTVNRSDRDEFEFAIYTFIVYRALKNSHPKDLLWWQNKLAENGYPVEMELSDVGVAFMFLSNLGVNVVQAEEFLSNYKSATNNNSEDKPTPPAKHFLASTWAENIKKTEPKNDEIFVVKQGTGSKFVLIHDTVDTSQKINGKPMEQKIRFERMSDSLEDLENIALVLRLGGETVQILDAHTRKPIQ